MAKDAMIHADHILDAIAYIEADTVCHDIDSFRADRRPANWSNAIWRLSQKLVDRF